MALLLPLSAVDSREQQFTRSPVDPALQLLPPTMEPPAISALLAAVTSAPSPEAAVAVVEAAPPHSLLPLATSLVPLIVRRDVGDATPSPNATAAVATTPLLPLLSTPVVAALAAAFRLDASLPPALVTLEFVLALVDHLAALADAFGEPTAHWLRLTNNAVMRSGELRSSFAVDAGGMAALFSFDVYRHHESTLLAWARLVHRLLASDESTRMYVATRMPAAAGLALGVVETKLAAHRTASTTDLACVECLAAAFALVTTAPAMLLEGDARARVAGVVRALALTLPTSGTEVASATAARRLLRPHLVAILAAAPPALWAVDDASGGEAVACDGGVAALPAALVALDEVREGWRACSEEGAADGVPSLHHTHAALVLLLALQATHADVKAAVYAALLGDVGSAIHAVERGNSVPLTLPPVTAWALQTAASSAVKAAAEELTFALCGGDAARFIAGVGMGNAIGLLVRRGLAGMDGTLKGEGAVGGGGAGS